MQPLMAQRRDWNSRLQGGDIRFPDYHQQYLAKNPGIAGWGMRGSLQIRGVTGGGEGLIAGLTLFPA
jgi:hypothetical protein